MRRQILGWSAVAISASIACFWAFWGINENFHEGWYSTSIWQNLGLMLVQYLSPMLLVMLLSALALRWPQFAFPLLLAAAVATAWFFRHAHAAAIFLVLPILVLGVLYHFGRPVPRHWAWRCLIALPLLTSVGFGIYPGWLAVHRFDDGNYGMRLIKANGLMLLWAPEGPGWPENGVSWYQARETCAHLTADGKTVALLPQNLWRLPNVDEAVRSLVFRGYNAGGEWNPDSLRARYRTTPDKDSPLWKVHSKVIYWWTSTEQDINRAYYITNNGAVSALPKRGRFGYLAYRCVTEPQISDVPGASFESSARGRELSGGRPH